MHAWCSLSCCCAIIILLIFILAVCCHMGIERRLTRLETFCAAMPSPMGHPWGCTCPMCAR
jgi:hypothetical protein